MTVLPHLQMGLHRRIWIHDVKSSEDTQTAEYVIVDDKNAFKDYVTLRTRRKHNDVALGDSGVVITEKLSKDLGVKKGDKITVTSSAGKQTEAVVSCMLIIMYI